MTTTLFLFIVWSVSLTNLCRVCWASPSSGSAATSKQQHERHLEMKATTPGEFPFFAQWGGCAATLIWEDILLTSAACNVLESDDVLVGAYVSMKEQNEAVGRRIIERRHHPEFDPSTFANNFMVLKLNRKVETLPTVSFQKYDEIPEGAELSVVGFGSTAARIHISKIDSEVFQYTVLDMSEVLRHGNDDGPVMRMNDAVLQKQHVAIVSQEECNADDQFAGFIDNKTMICAGNPEDGGDICKFYWVLGPFYYRFFLY